MMSLAGKRKQNRVQKVMKNIDFYSNRIRLLLIDKKYQPSRYIEKTIEDGASKKIRTICKPMYYPDQIIHWALMLQLQPVIMKGMYEYSCGSVPGRGTSYGQKTVRKWLDKDYKSTKYCLKMDVSKFYPSVSNQLLKNAFRRVLKDNDCLWLIDAIIDGSVGLPIGNYTSQWFSNFFLQGLDHYIKEKLGVKYYVRYVDDLVLFGGNKKELHKVRKEVSGYLSSIGLSMKGDWQVFKVNSRAVDFLGFRFFRHKTILRKRNALRIRRRIAKIKKKKRLNYKDACAVVSYWGWIKRSNSFNFYNKHIKPIISVGRAKKAVSKYAKSKVRQN
jgi:RNA-directed DNA polymerase